ncbi:hypothetical protein KFL_000840080 [Klebsormidium nitens]|uniref:Methyltransferase FkbM domain-containing protein n=1 Tax=Klebsormidium nitens TaxID=105231 RepID=A0A1Y1HSF8_KLENI|nr:hypothetical protein KFL_000840080 [Klebsormidium nitens]|eukprot:GAQ81565.1 hypothetical protein KFL_000840080 [Klebsormidium nitens]
MKYSKYLPSRVGNVKWNMVVPVVISLIFLMILWQQLVRRSSPDSSLLMRSIPQSYYVPTVARDLRFPPARSRAFRCSDAQRVGQAATWRALLDSQEVSVNCADSVYLGFVREFLQEQAPVLINVGANKGYGIMQWLIAFDGSFGFSLKDAYTMYESRFKGQPRLCGVCQDCEEVPRSLSLLSHSGVNSTATLIRKPVIYAFEPAVNNSLVLKALKDMIQYPSVEIIRAAASNVTGKMYFTNCAAGQETCRLVAGAGKGTTVIDATTIDRFLQTRNIQKVDILKIDAEGYDPLVLQGAQSALALHKIRVLEFEYHEIEQWGAWRRGSSSLEEVTAWLDDLGYDCYLESAMNKVTKTGATLQFDLVRLTGCWDSRLEIRKWSNVACVLREELEMSMMFFKASRWLDLYI